MIRSMTGFGRGEYENEGRKYIVEIKAVNHKYSDINIRLPRFFNNMEDLIRKRISNVISRGKIDVFVSFENYSGKGTNIRINRELAKEYINELKSLAEETGLEFNVNLIDISKLPEILKLEENEDEEEIESELMMAVDVALAKFIKMRETEGEKLVQDIEKRIHIIEKKLEEIKKYSGNLVEEYMEKLQTRITEILKTEVDEARLMQEIVLFSDKSSIEEELTRLDSHISQFLKLIKTSSPVGKKIDFLIQEINRETNTIGSKANCLEITNRVIEIKTEVENIREQIQNIE